MNTASSVVSVSTELGVSRTTVYNWIESGCPHKRVQRGLVKVIRLDITDVKNWYNNKYNEPMK